MAFKFIPVFAFAAIALLAGTAALYPVVEQHHEAHEEAQYHVYLQQQQQQQQVHEYQPDYHTQHQPEVYTVHTPHAAHVAQHIHQQQQQQQHEQKQQQLQQIQLQQQQQQQHLQQQLHHHQQQQQQQVQHHLVAAAQPQQHHQPQHVYVQKVHESHDHHEYSDDTHPQYNFAYDVQDAVSGDSKSQTETRDGDVVQGEYSLNDADGFRRTVKYTADSVNGFNAVVSREPLTHKVVAHAQPQQQQQLYQTVPHATTAVVKTPVAYTSHATPSYAALSGNYEQQQHHHATYQTESGEQQHHFLPHHHHQHE